RTIHCFLHSFPTRRSSDLLPRVLDRLALEPLGGQAGRGDGAATPERLELRVLDHTGLEIHLDLQLHDVPALGGAHETGAHAGLRSEEHTSELQSRVDLVCR